MQRQRFVLLLMLSGSVLDGVALLSEEDSTPPVESMTPGVYCQAQLTLNGAASILRPSIAHVELSRRRPERTRVDPALLTTPESPSIASVKSPTPSGFQLLRWRDSGVPDVSEGNGQRSPPTPDGFTADKEDAVTLIRAGKFKEAIDRLQVLKKTGPSDIFIQVILVDAYFKAGMRSDGEKETQEALGSSTLTETAGLALAKVLIEDKQRETAQRVLEDLTIEWPESAETHGELGLLLSAKSQFDRAAWELGRAVQLKPDFVGYVQALAEVLLSWRHYATALDFVTAEEQRLGKLPDLQYCLAFSLYGLRRHNEALGILDKLLEQYPRFDRAYFLAGNCYVS